MESLKLLGLFLIVLLMGNCSSKKKISSNPYCGKPYEIRNYLLKNKMVLPMPVEIDGDFKSDYPCPNVDNYANLKVVADSEIKTEIIPWDFSAVLENEQKAAIKDGYTTRAVITKNENFCDMNVEEIHLKIKEDYQVSIFTHIWENPDKTKTDTVFLIYNQLW